MKRIKLVLVGLATIFFLTNAAVAQEVPDEMPFNIPYGAPIAVETAKIAVEAAARFRRPTAAFFEAMENGHPYVATLHPDVVASPGGIPLVVNGELIGAIGCSGATGAQDAVACQAGLEAITR